MGKGEIGAKELGKKEGWHLENSAGNKLRSIVQGQITEGPRAEGRGPWKPGRKDVAEAERQLCLGCLSFHYSSLYLRKDRNASGRMRNGAIKMIMGPKN